MCPWTKPFAGGVTLNFKVFLILICSLSKGASTLTWNIVRYTVRDMMETVKQHTTIMSQTKTQVKCCLWPAVSMCMTGFFMSLLVFLPMILASVAAPKKSNDKFTYHLLPDAQNVLRKFILFEKFWVLYHCLLRWLYSLQKNINCRFHTPLRPDWLENV